MHIRRAKMFVPVLISVLVLIGLAGVALIKSRPPAHVRQATREKPQTTKSQEPASADADPNLVVYETPEDCFRAYKNAVAQSNVAVTLTCLVPSDRDQCVGWYAYYLDREIFHEREHADASKALLEKHEIKPGFVMGVMHKFAWVPPQDRAQLVATIGSRIKDPIPFAVEAAKLVKVSAESFPVKEDPLDLIEVENDGAVAIGKVKNQITGKPDQIIFKQLSGSWLIATDL